MKSDRFAQKVAEQLDFPINLEILKTSYSSKLVNNSVFFYISATSNDPQKAQKIANVVTRLFLSEGITQTNSSNNQDTDILNETVKKQRQELADLQTEIDNIKEQIRVLQTDSSNPKTLENLQTLRQNLKDTLDIQSKLVLSINDVESKNTAANHDSASLVDDAKLPLTPEGHSTLRNLAFAAALAFVLGISVIVLLDFLDYTVRSSEELAQLTGYATLGVVPVVKPGSPKETTSFAADSAGPDMQEVSKPGPTLVTASEFKSAGSESYRALRTNILFSTLSNNFEELELKIQTKNTSRKGQHEPLLKSFVVTSAIPKEGKSQTAANLAVVFAQAGNKVILIDADLRQPTLHTYFGLPNKEGFSDLMLVGLDDLESYLRTTCVPNLTLLTAGTPPPNPSELLTSAKATKVIEAVEEKADILIFDSPPVVLVSDAAILANRVDCVLLVFRSGSTRRDAILKAINSLKKVGANVMGTVLNRVQNEDDGGYYYYNYSGYGSESKTSRSKSNKKKNALVETSSKEV
jgi:capsular exopolysaccharide synthesis family protein